MGAHSPIGASGAYRWLKCPGSVALSEGLISESSHVAKLGTAAHYLGELALTGQPLPEVIDVEGECFPVDQNMKDAVKVYFDEVQRRAAEMGVKPNIETTFSLTCIDPEAFGTNDASLYSKGRLDILDYKHGEGIVVEVMYEKPVVYWTGATSIYNPQLMYYGIGAVMSMGVGKPVDQINLVIVQPRARHQDGPIRSVTLKWSDLHDWHDRVLKPGIEAVRNTKKGENLCAGEWCGFCPAKQHNKCPELTTEMCTAIGQSADQVFGPSEIVLPDPESMTDEQLVKLYEFSGMFDKWLKSVKEAALKKLMKGGEISGLKLVAGRASRKWKDEKSAEEFLTGALSLDAFDRKLKSPAAAEKALKAAGMSVEDLAEYVDTSRGYAVAPESDKREEIELQNAKEAFRNEH